MSSKRQAGRGRFLAAIAAWSVALVAVTLLYQLFSGFPPGATWSIWGLIFPLASWFGLFLPFASFAGGLVAPAAWPPRSVALRALLFSAVSYGLLAYGSPIARYRYWATSGEELSVGFPYGPETPEGLRALRSSVEAAPPDTYSHSVDHPTLQPPNWLTYRIHSPAVLALFAVLAALLGQQCGFLTIGLSPPTRRNARWALGLLSAGAFFVAEAVGGDWVRLDPSNSGIAGAWIPLSVPVLELVILTSLVRWHHRRLHTSGSSGVQ